MMLNLQQIYNPTEPAGKVMNAPFVSIVIATYKRAQLLNYALEGLTNQTYRNFEVLIILKPSGDGTEDIIKKYTNLLEIRLIIQTKGYVVDALNLGLKNAKGYITAFLDDDAIPTSDWVHQHVKTYAQSNVGGVAGDVISASLNEKKGDSKIECESSQLVPNCKTFMIAVGARLWSCPLKGLEDHLVYISKAGLVDYNFGVANRANQQIVKSLLGMGANMSVLTEALKGYQLPNSWVLGLSSEQFLGWHIWKKGFNLLFNPNIKVYHLTHGQTLTRNLTDHRKQALRQIEANLLFYRLYGIEPGISWVNRVSWLIFNNIFTLKKICKDKEIYRITNLKSNLRSEVIGLKWILSKKLGGHYNPLKELENLL